MKGKTIPLFVNCTFLMVENAVSGTGYQGLEWVETGVFEVFED